MDKVTLTGSNGAGDYVVIDNGVAGFQAGSDGVIKVTNSGIANVSASSFV